MPLRRNRIGRHEFQSALDAIAERYDEEIDEERYLKAEREGEYDNVIAFPQIVRVHPSWNMKCDEDGFVILS